MFCSFSLKHTGRLCKKKEREITLTEHAHSPHIVVFYFYAWSILWSTTTNAVVQYCWSHTLFKKSFAFYLVWKSCRIRQFFYLLFMSCHDKFTWQIPVILGFRVVYIIYAINQLLRTLIIYFKSSYYVFSFLMIETCLPSSTVDSDYSSCNSRA